MKKETLLFAFAILLIVSGAALVALTIIGQVNMPWTITAPPPTASMNPNIITLSIGSIAVNETKSVAPANVATLTVSNGALNINASLGGEYSGFDAISVIVQLKQAGEVKYQAEVTKSSTTATISNVEPGTYDVYIGYTVTAGNTPSSGVAVITFSTP